MSHVPYFNTSIQISVHVLCEVHSLQAVMVHTNETMRLRYFVDLLMANSRPVMLVGNAGCGKTVLINDKLNSFNKEEMLVTMLPLNYYTSSLMLQQVL